jgi:hypothetical protein
VVAAVLWCGAVLAGGRGRVDGLQGLCSAYLRCVVKAVPMAIAAGAANLLAGVWAATGRVLAGSAQRSSESAWEDLRRRRDCCAILCANMLPM